MPKPSARDEVARQHLLDVGDVARAAPADLPAIRLVGLAHDRRHHGVLPFDARARPRPCPRHRPARRRSSTRCGAPRAAGSRRPPSGTCSRASSLTSCAMSGATPPSCAWPNASLRAGFGQELAVGVAQPFGHADAAVAVLLDALARRAARNCVLVERDLGEQEDVRRRRRPSRRPGRTAAVIQPACRPITSSTKTLRRGLAPSRRRRSRPRASTRRRTWRPSRSPGSSR